MADLVVRDPGTTMTWNVRALAVAGAAVSAASMLVLGILGNAGVYDSGVRAMQQWHVYFDTTPAGIVAGMAEAAIATGVLLAAIGWTYNRLEAWGRPS